MGNSKFVSRAPVFIIGAGRSGTNLLAQVIGEDPRFWNSFENRYIWNYGAKTLVHDLRTSDEVTPKVRAYIRRFFERMEEEHKARIIDKTPSNVFRVEFAHAVMPEARFINVLRDGRDNVLSRQAMWYGGQEVFRSGLDLGLEQSGHSDRLLLLRQRIDHLVSIVGRGNLPPERLPYFFMDNIGPFFKNLVTGQPGRWGDRFPGMSEALKAYGVLITAGIQWREGVMHATQAGRRLPSDIYLEVRYEDLLSDPEYQWERIAGFLEISPDGPSLDFLRGSLRPGNSGKWRGRFTEEQLSALELHIRPTMQYLNYAWD